MRKAAMINFISRYSIVLIQLIISLILARIISPYEYGVVTIITVFTSFFSVLSNMGIGTAIIQYKELKQGDYNALFSFTFYFGLLLGSTFSAIGLLVARLYGNHVYVSLGFISAFSVFFNTLDMVPSAIMLKEQRFLEIGIKTIVTAAVCGGIEIALALLHFSYYAVVIYSVLQSVTIYIWDRARISLKFNFRFDTAPLKKVFCFSVYQMMFNIINYFAGNTDTLLVGHTMGEQSVGLYDKAYRLMTYPMTMFSGIITPVLHPILSNYQKDKILLYDYLIKIFRILLYFSVFVSCVCYFASGEIICILYGKQWIPAVKAFQLLSLSIVTKMCNSITGAFFQSLGKTKALFKTGLVSAGFIVAFTLIGVSGGTIECVAVSVSIGYLFNFWIAYYFLIKGGFGISYFGFVKLVIKPYAAYILTLILVSLFPIIIENIFVSLVVKVIVAGSIYFLLLKMMGEIPNVKNAYRVLFKGGL